jgi:hypothetical protein
MKPTFRLVRIAECSSCGNDKGNGLSVLKEITIEQHNLYGMVICISRPPGTSLPRLASVPSLQIITIRLAQLGRGQWFEVLT